jgi:hypothetical protein
MSMNLVAGAKKDVLARTHQTQRRPSPGQQKFRRPDICSASLDFEHDRLRRLRANREGDFMRLIAIAAALLCASTTAFGQTCTGLGSSTFCDNGLTGTRVGDSTFWSDGVSSTRVGDSKFYSDGTSARRVGGSTFYSDGTSATQVGDTTFFSNGRSALASAALPSATDPAAS